MSVILPGKRRMTNLGAHTHTRTHARTHTVVECMYQSVCSILCISTLHISIKSCSDLVFQKSNITSQISSLKIREGLETACRCLFLGKHVLITTVMETMVYRKKCLKKFGCQLWAGVCVLHAIWFLSHKTHTGLFCIAVAMSNIGGFTGSIYPWHSSFCHWDSKA